jgi:hypothetical protein
MKYSFQSSFSMKNGVQTGSAKQEWTLTSRAEARALLKNLRDGERTMAVAAVIGILMERLSTKGRFRPFTITVNNPAHV